MTGAAPHRFVTPYRFVGMPVLPFYAEALSGALPSTPPPPRPEDVHQAVLDATRPADLARVRAEHAARCPLPHMAAAIDAILAETADALARELDDQLRRLNGEP